MKSRKRINYEDIVEIGKKLIMEQTEFLWDCNGDNERASFAYAISGIVDFWDRLDKATQMTEKEVDEAADEFMRNLNANLSVDSEDLNKYYDENHCCRE